MNIPRIVGFLLVLTTLMVGIGSNLPAMFDPPSLILVIGTVLGMLLIGRHSIGGMVSAVAQEDFMRLIGLILLVASLVFGSGVNALAMIAPPSFIITIGGTVGALLFAGVSIPSMVKVFFSGDAGAEVSKEEAPGCHRIRGLLLSAAQLDSLGVCLS